MRRWGGVTIFVLALIPNPLFDIAGAAAGALKYPVWKFMLYGFLGRWPKSVFYAYVGIWFSTVLTWF
jgi:membrane protein YqaA with SNARE-associated domain